MNPPAAVVDGAPYWSAVVATVPVFALALVLEARRGASRWLGAPAALRVGWAVGVVLYAVTLYVLFFEALSALEEGRGTDEAWWVTAGLTGLLTAAVLNPLIDVAVRSTSDIRARLWARTPTSSVGRIRREGRAIRREYAAMLRRARRLVRTAERALAEARDFRRELERGAARWEAQFPVKLGELAERAARGEIDAAEVERQQANADVAVGTLEIMQQRLDDAEARLKGRLSEAQQIVRDVEASQRTAEAAVADAVVSASERAMSEAKAILDAALREWGSR